MLEDGVSETTVTELAHIFDRSTTEGLHDERKVLTSTPPVLFLLTLPLIKASYASSALAVLSRFGKIDTVRELNGPGLHRLENVLTLAADIHRLFDKLHIWLERNPGVSARAIVKRRTVSLILSCLLLGSY